jgi:hypothetical protein
LLIRRRFPSGGVCADAKVCGERREERTAQTAKVSQKRVVSLFIVVFLINYSGMRLMICRDKKRTIDGSRIVGVGAVSAQ